MSLVPAVGDHGTQPPCNDELSSVSTSHSMQDDGTAAIGTGETQLPDGGDADASAQTQRARGNATASWGNPG